MNNRLTFHILKITVRLNIIYVCCFAIDIDDCAEDPCKYTATCVDKVAGFECACAENAEGPLCEGIKKLYCFK